MSDHILFFNNSVKKQLF